MKSKIPKSLFAIKKGSELFLTGNALAEVGKAVISKGLPFRFRAKGFSMFPFIKDGDIVVVYPLNSNVNLECGDVVAFIHPDNGKLIIHRIIKVKGNIYSVKGDHNKIADSFILKENILGYITEVDRGHKRVSFGFGLEKRLISILSRNNFLFYILNFISKFHVSPKHSIQNE